MRQLLGVLRSDEDPLLLSPQPGLCQLDRLLEDVRQAGLPVDSRVQGTPVPLPPAIDLAAYRIVQEALTNILKHQGRVPATVVVGYRVEDLQVRVAGVGRLAPQPHAAPGTGHGLAGMRERVAMLGGELDAGPDPQAASWSPPGSRSRGDEMTIRVLIADDQALVRAGFRMILQSQPDMAVIGEAGDGNEAVRLARRHEPDVVLMDIRMPELDGIPHHRQQPRLPPPRRHPRRPQRQHLDATPTSMIN
jgi:Response regulator receiver domain